MTHHLAQLNIGTVRFPLESEGMRGFVDALDEINALAETSPGFIWRLTGDGNDATSLRPYDDDRIIVNMSVWTDLESLKNYVYKSVHADYLRRRKEWFEAMREAYTVLWWVNAGHTPTVAEAVSKLEHLRAHGSTAQAFAFRDPHPAPSLLETRG
jgi:heme-degrading monooxygenase HmoA